VPEKVISEPVPIILVNKIIKHFSYPVIVTGLAIFIPSFLFYFLSGAMYPSTIKPWDQNPLEMTGLF